MDWWSGRLREARWLELSVEESVRVSLDMDGSRPGERTRGRNTDDLSVNPLVFVCLRSDKLVLCSMHRQELDYWGLKVAALKL